MRAWMVVLVLAVGACPTRQYDPEPDAGTPPASSSSGSIILLRFDAGSLRGNPSSSSQQPASSSVGGGSSGGASSGSADAGFPPAQDGGGPPPHPDAGVVTVNDNQPCTVWQDCAPHYGDLNSGYECVSGHCNCDPVGQWSSKCVSDLHGFWVALECYCVIQTSTAPPSENPDPNPSDNVQCWWTWHSTGCEPDRWVDTSHYERRCNPDCRDVWVNSGYWQSGSCTGGRWIKRCDDGTEIWY